MRFRILFLFELVSLSYAHLNVSSLDCFYDYEDTMVCESTSGVPLNCSAYILDLVSQDHDHFRCAFTNSSRNSGSLSKCGCTIKMLKMVNTEKYTTNLLEEGRVIHKKIITALDIIKPRAPEILSVVEMENGNYNIVCKNHYDEQSFLYEKLETLLSYRKKGEADLPWRTITATLPSQEIAGKDLVPNSIYIVKARSHSPHYNTQFSDWSPEVEWTVPKRGIDEGQSVWKMIVPVLSVLLAIVLCASYLCWTRLKTQWWDRIPTPRKDIKYMLPGNSRVFTPKLYDPWSMRPDALIIAQTEEKSWVLSGRSEYDRDASYKNVRDSGVGFPEDCRTSLSGSVGSCASSQSGYRNILCPRSPAPGPGPGSGSGSCRFCGEPEALEAPGPLRHLEGGLQAPDSPGQTSPVPTDLEYRPCDGGRAGAPVPAGGAEPPRSEADVPDASPRDAGAPTRAIPCRADDGYESFSEAVARAAQSRADFPACTLAPCEEGYQALETAAAEHSPRAPGEADTEEFWAEGPMSSAGQAQDSPRPAQSHAVIPQSLPKTKTESPSHPALNSPPLTQTFIDCSYQRA